MIWGKEILKMGYKLVIFVLLLAVVDFGLGKALRYFYFRQETGRDARIRYAMYTADQQLIFFGSSACLHHYIPEVFASRLSLKAYNAGEDAQGILYHLALLKTMLKRHTPELILLDLSRRELFYEEGSYDNLSLLFPYYHDEKQLRGILELKGPYEKLKLLSGIYPYNSKLVNILAGFSKLNTSRVQDYNGYVPLSGSQIRGMRNDSSEYSGLYLDPNKIKALEDFLTIATKSGSRVIIVYSPYYMLQQSANASKTKVMEIAAKCKVPVWDYSADPAVLSHTTWFYEESHLNASGAVVYSEKIAGEIVKLLAGNDNGIEN